MRLNHGNDLRLTPAVLGLCLAMVASAPGASAQRRSESSHSSYTSFGRNRMQGSYAGGPYVVGAIWDPMADGGTGEIRVIFNEAIDPGSIENPALEERSYDFKPHGFDWSPSGPFGSGTPTEVTLLDIPTTSDQRVVALRGFSATNPPEEGDSISLRSLAEFLQDFADEGFGVNDWTRGVASAEPGNPIAHDLSIIPIALGPHLVSVSMSPDWSTVPMSDAALEALTIYLEFDADIRDPSSWATVDSAQFKLAPELKEVVGTQSFALNVDPAQQNVLEMTWRAASGGEHFRWMLPGVSKFVLGAGAVEDSLNGMKNSTRQSIMIDNAGPQLIGATLDGSNDLWLVWNTTVDRLSIDANPLADPDYIIHFAGEGSWGTDPIQWPALPEGFTGVLKIEGAYDQVELHEPGDAIEATLSGPRNYQAVPPHTTAGPVQIGSGICILRASYDAKGTTAADDDELIVVFNEPFAVDPQHADFEMIPSDFDSVFEQLTLTVQSFGPLGIATFTGFSNASALGNQRLPLGMGVKLTADAAVRGVSTYSEPAHSAMAVPVYEDLVDWPGASAVEIVEPVAKLYAGGEISYDDAYVSWRQSGGSSSSDDWFAFYTNQHGALSQLFINDFASSALPLGDYQPEVYDATQAFRKRLDIGSGTITTDGRVLEEGDTVSAMVVPATFRGSLAPFGAALVFSTKFIVGPPCPPLDFSPTQDNLIDVTARELSPGVRTYAIVGAANAAPCGDSVLVFDDPLASAAVNIIGRGRIHTAERSFGPITLTTSTPDSVVWLRSKNVAGEISEMGEPSSVYIIIDTVDPHLVRTAGNGLLIAHADRFNPYHIYGSGDYVNLLAKVLDGSPIAGSTAADEAVSDLLKVTADFTACDTRNQHTTGDPVGAIPLVSLGADATDNDGDWDDTSPNAGHGNGQMNFPEPYTDEDGNGFYTPGEAFIDRDGDHLCDAPRDAGGESDPPGLIYDWFLDSTDEDEHGWYEIRLTATPGLPPGTWESGDPDSANVGKGFPLLAPITAGGEQDALPVYVSVADSSAGAQVIYDDPPSGEKPVAFFCEIDELPPASSEILEIRNAEARSTGSVGPNLYHPLDPVYRLGRYVHVVATQQDTDDVLYGVIEIYADRDDDGTWSWEIISLDPPGQNNGGSEGYPGLPGYDDDEDGAADYQDPEVSSAHFGAASDAADNDGDAFFTFEPYYDGGAHVYQRVIWHNVDEDGERYTVSNDENEDGISGEFADTGEGVPVAIDGFYVIWDRLGVGVPGTIHVPAATVLGARRGAGDDDLGCLTELTDRAYGVMDNGYTRVGTGHTWGDSTVLGPELSFYDLREPAEYLDFSRLAPYYLLQRDGATVYQLRVLACDQAGNIDSSRAYPIAFTLVDSVFLDYADLEVVAVYPDTIPALEAALIEIQVANRGTGDAWETRTRLILDGDPVCSDLPTDPLPAGEIRSVYCEISGLPPGDFPLTVGADVPDWIDESDETDNEWIGNLHVVGSPDLVVSNVTPTAMIGGRVETISIEVRNQGTIHAPSSVTSLLVSGQPICPSISTPELAVGENTHLACIVGPFDPGDYPVEVCADATELVNEGDESNNCLLDTLRVMTAPDLVISDVEPDRLFASQSVEMHITVENVGTDSAIASATALVLDGQMMCAGIQTSALAPGEGTQVSCVVGPLAPGIYTRRTCADTLHAVSESLEENNCLVDDITVEAAPDLVILGVEPTTVLASQSIDLAVTVHNQGTAHAVASSASLQLSDSLTCPSIPIPALAVGEQAEVNCMVGPYAPGDLSLHVCVDVGDIVLESSEENNCYDDTLRVLAAPDLVVLDVVPDTRLGYQAITLQISVGNNGTADAATSEASVQIDGELVCASIATPVVLVSQSVDLSCAIGPLTPGTHNYEVCVDTKDQLLEPDEGNNFASDTLGIREVSDLVVVSVEPDVIPGDQPYDLDITVRNIGPVAAEASETALVLRGEAVCPAIATPELGAGQEVILTCSIEPLDVGAYSMRACADTGHVVVEVSETNNCFLANLYVDPPVGACCHADGDCEELTEDRCVALGGYRWVRATPCEPTSPCVAVFGELSLVSGASSCVWHATTDAGLTALQGSYRRGGDTDFTDAIPFEGGQGTWSLALPGEVCSIRGVEYFLRYTTPLGTEGLHGDSLAPLRLSIRGSLKAPALDALELRMIAAPMRVDSALTMASYLQSVHGQAGPRSWQMGRWSDRDSAYVMVEPGHPVGFLSGHAYWLGFAAAQPPWYLTGETHFPPEDGKWGFQIDLENGWNMIGNPAAYPITLNHGDLHVVDGQDTLTYSAAATRDLVGNAIYVYDPDLDPEGDHYPYRESTSYATPWQGFWIRNSAHRALSLLIPAREVEATSPVSLAEEGTMETQLPWSLRVLASAGGERASVTIGLSALATDGRDVVDRYLPPAPPGRRLFLALGDDASAPLLQDVRSVHSPGVVWTLEVLSPTHEVQLQWNEAAVSAASDSSVEMRALELRLLAATHVLDMRRYRSLDLPAGHHMLQVHMGGTGTGMGQALQHSVLVTPNPANTLPAILYACPMRADVHLEIFDPTGARIWEQRRDSMPVGQHAVFWRQADRQNPRVPSGIYYLRFSTRPDGDPEARWTIVDTKTITIVR